MNCLLILMFAIYLQCIQTENISLNPGEENLYSILTGDTLTLRCPVHSLNKNDVRWSFMNDIGDTILSIGDKLTRADFRFSIAYTDHLQQFIYLRIYNITLKEQTTYTCYYEVETQVLEYKYFIRLANVSNSLIINQSGKVCCVLHGKHIKAANFVWEHRTLFDEHVRYIESAKMNGSRTPGRNYLSMNKLNHSVSCLKFDINRRLSYNIEGRYICTAQLFIDGRNQPVNKTTSIEIENIQDQPLCIQETKSQRSILGANISISIQFYSKPKYLALSFRKDNCQLKLLDIVSVYITNISLSIYNVTVMVSGYEILLNINEFSQKDIGYYTAVIKNEFGNSNCTVRLLSSGNDHRQVNHTVEIEAKNGFLELQSFLGFGILTVSFILLLSSVICNIVIHLYCKKIANVQFEIEEIDISRQDIGITETNNGYHSIIEDNIQPETFEIEQSFEMTRNNRESLDVPGVQFDAGAGGDELHILEDDYLHPYCTVMQQTIEVHEYQGVITGHLVHDGTDIFSNEDIQGTYENIDI